MMPVSTVDVSTSAERNAEGVVDALERLAGGARYFRAVDGRFHAQVPVENRHEIYGLLSPEFRDWLSESYRNERGELPPGRAVGRVLSSLKVRARLGREGPAVSVRVGRPGEPGKSCDESYLDLGDASGQAVKISALEWSVVDRPPVHFWRPDGLTPLPLPERGGSIERLRPFVNLSEPDFRLLVGWMAAALAPEGPYPILAIHGEQGSSKSTLARIVRLLVDPQVSPVLAQPRSTRDLMVTAFGGWLLVFDNISTVPDWFSDGLCRLATGGGFAGRALFSDTERSVIHAQRPVILNGIDDFVRRDDLADRCVFLHLPPICPTSRRSEVEFWRSFRVEYPAILGGLLDAIVGGLRELPALNLAELPRMADFARFGEAIGRGLGWPAEAFLSIYTENRQAASVLALEDSPIAQQLLLIASMGRLRQWTLSATKMLRHLTSGRQRRTTASARWPKSARELSNELRRIAPILRTRGITVKFTRTRDSRLITINAERTSDYSSVTHNVIRNRELRQAT
jgi:hypothetical protein